MQNIMTSAKDSYQEIKRSDSNLTICSAIAEAKINEQLNELNNKASAQNLKISTNNPTKINIENTETIYVGCPTYHIHHHSNDTSSVGSISIGSTSKGSDLSTIISIKYKNEKQKRIWIIPIVLSVFAITASTTISIYYITKNNRNYELDISTSVSPFTSTTTITSSTLSTSTTFTSGNTTTEENPKLYVSRSDWGANPPRSSKIEKLDLPIKRIIIAHTATDPCFSQNDCTVAVKSIQTKDPTLDDIPYNFLIGGDERIYEGRGIEFHGQHTQNLDATEYNSIGICIAFIGNYQSVPPDERLIEVLNNFIEEMIECEKIDANYVMVSQDNLKYLNTSTTALTTVLGALNNFCPLYKVYRRENWQAQRIAESRQNLSSPVDWLIIDHTTPILCNDLISCMTRMRKIQADDMASSWNDIQYNIVFGGDGFAFEGQGWDAVSYVNNHKAISIGVIGDFSLFPPNQYILQAMSNVFKDAIILGKLSKEYKIFGHCDFGGSGPGEAFMEIIRKLPNYGNND